MPILGIVAASIKPAPAAPTIGTATNVGTGRAFNDGAATVAFTPGAGPTATSFTAVSSPGGFNATGASSPLTVQGLQSGVSYTFTVTATNAAGTSPASNASNSVTATTVPQAPTIGTATGGNATASVTFTANANGGSAITGFTATSSPGSITGTNTVSPITVSGLSNGTAYTFTVTATNANGTSLPSAASNSTTPNVTLSAWTLSTVYPAGNPVGVRGVGGMTNQDSWWGSGFNDNLTSSVGGYSWANGSSSWNTVNINRNDSAFAGMQRISASQAVATGGYNWSGGVNTNAASTLFSNSWGNTGSSYPFATNSMGIARITGGLRYVGGEVNGNRTYSQSNESGPFTQQANWPLTGSAYGIDTGSDGSGEGLYFPRTGTDFVYSTPNNTSSTFTARASQPEASSYVRAVSSNNSYIIYSPIGAPGNIIYTFNPTTNTFTNVGTAPTTTDRFSIAFDRTSNRVRGVESQTTSTANRRHWFATLG